MEGSLQSVQKDREGGEAQTSQKHCGSRLPSQSTFIDMHFSKETGVVANAQAVMTRLMALLLRDLAICTVVACRLPVSQGYRFHKILMMASRGPHR